MIEQMKELNTLIKEKAVKIFDTSIDLLNLKEQLSNKELILKANIWNNKEMYKNEIARKTALENTKNNDDFKKILVDIRNLENKIEIEKIELSFLKRKFKIFELKILMEVQNE